MPDGKEHVVTDPKAARGLKIELLKGQLAREEETRDPTFRQRTEAEVRARAPMRVMLSWDDLSGGGTIEFTVADSRTCGLPAGPLDLNAADLPRYTCLDRPRTRNRWEGDARLKLLVQPTTRTDARFPHPVPPAPVARG